MCSKQERVGDNARQWPSQTDALTDPTLRGAFGTITLSSMGAWYSTRCPNTFTQFAGLFHASLADGNESGTAAGAGTLEPLSDEAMADGCEAVQSVVDRLWAFCWSAPAQSKLLITVLWNVLASVRGPCGCGAMVCIVGGCMWWSGGDAVLAVESDGSCLQTAPMCRGSPERLLFGQKCQQSCLATTLNYVRPY